MARILLIDFADLGIGDCFYARNYPPTLFVKIPQRKSGVNARPAYNTLPHYAFPDEWTVVAVTHRYYPDMPTTEEALTSVWSVARNYYYFLVEGYPSIPLRSLRELKLSIDTAAEFILKSFPQDKLSED